MKKCPLLIILIVTTLAVSLPGAAVCLRDRNLIYPTAAITINAAKNAQYDMLYDAVVGVPDTLESYYLSVSAMSSEGEGSEDAAPEGTDDEDVSVRRAKFFRAHGIDESIPQSAPVRNTNVVVVDTADDAHKVQAERRKKGIAYVDELMDHKDTVSGENVLSGNEAPSDETEAAYDDDDREKEEEDIARAKAVISANEAEVEPGEDITSLPFETVGDEYFADACFIGDSRVQGLGMYSGLPATNYGIVGLQLYKVFDKKVIPTEEGKITIPEAMAGDVRYGKIYLGFGLNEMGWGNEQMFDEYYYYLIDYLKAVQPDAVIYVMGVIHVTQEEEDRSPLYQNSLIDIRNIALKDVAANEHVIFLDLNEVFTDEFGNLASEDSFDGVHIKANAIYKWSDYLKEHAIVR